MRDTRTLIECGDILGIELECPNCGAKVMYSLKTIGEKIALRCPNPPCGAEDLFILDPAVPGIPERRCESLDHIANLIRAIKSLDAKPKDLKANIRLHVTTP